MKKEHIIEILEDWNFWRKKLDTGIKRKEYIESCLKYLKSNIVIAIIGVRRAGKSYIMRQIIKKLIGKGIKQNQILMINFEDKRFVEFYLLLYYN